MRKITSITALLAFSFLILTSVILYVVPQGRVAYWSDWTLWGLSKTQWGNLHINLGVLLLLSMLLHVYYNWKVLLSYLKDKAKNLKIFTKAFNVALLVTLAFIVGTLLYVPPFSTILAISEGIKDTGAVRYGEPPYGHAELSSLKNFSKKMGWDVKQATQKLKDAGLSCENEGQTILELAKANGLSPHELFLVMKPEEPKAAPGTPMPESPVSGTGNRTLADICHEYGLHIKKIEQGLAAKGIKAKAGKTLKEIAQENNSNPVDVYAVIQELSLQAK